MNQNYGYEASDNEENSDPESRIDENSMNYSDQSPPLKSKNSLKRKATNEQPNKRSSIHRKTSFSKADSIEIKQGSLDRRGSHLSGRIDETLEDISEVEGEEDYEDENSLEKTPTRKKRKSKNKGKKGFRIKGKKKKLMKRGSRFNSMSADFESEEEDEEDEGVPVREYYEKSLTPILLEGLKELGRKRPQNPVKFLGEFLLKNDPEN